jgi:hypothetical protein
VTVEGSVDLVIVVAILFEDIPQKHQFSLQAVVITESSGPVHQSREYHLFIGWVMMEFGVAVEIGVCGLAVHFVSQRAIRSLVTTQKTPFFIVTAVKTSDLTGLL